VWDDNENQDGKRPESIKVQLYADGKPSGEAVTLSSGGNWTYTWNSLPEKSNGKPITYTVKEVGSKKGKVTYNGVEYTVEITGSAKESYTITNSQLTEVSGTKTWYDGGNESVRPDSITLHLYKKSESLEKTEVTDAKPTWTKTDANKWNYSYTNLPKYENGEELTYTITEDPVDGYISEVDGYDVTNTRSAAVSKVDIGTGEELTGAHFQVLDGVGNIVDEWDSESGTNHVIKGIETDVKYTLHESKAPEGYEVTADVTFTVAKDGTVTATASVVNGVIIVEDKLKPSENTSTTIEKKITYNGLELFTENLSFYVRLFYDEACTKPATELKEIKIVNAMSGKVTFDNLEAGRTYYAGECDADGNVMYSGVLEDGTVYTPVFTGTNGQVVTVEKGENKVVYLDNQLQSWPHNFYAKGTLTVTKKLLGADGEAKDSDEVFYAGIFDDPEYTTLSERVEYNLLELDMSGGSETSMSTNVQIESLDSVTTLYVTEVDEDGNPVKGAPGFAYEVSADKTEVNIDPKQQQKPRSQLQTKRSLMKAG
ncbi:MAG: Cna B-type domain-containing protein, partial [Lachnospiraceae bacterium]